MAPTGRRPAEAPKSRGNRLNDQLFRDADAITRSADELQVDYTTWEIVGRIWREHLRPRIGLLAVAMIAMLLTAATTGAIPFLIQRTADDVFVAKNEQMIYWIVAAIVVVTIVKAIAEYVADVTVAYLGHRFIADLRLQMFAKLARADLNWIQKVHSGRLLASFLNDALLIRQTASRSLVTLGENYLKVIILLGAMFYMDPRFSMLILVFMPFAWFLLSRQRRKMRKSTTKSLQETGDLSALISQTLRGMRVVRAYQQEDREEARAASAIHRALEFTMRGTRARALSSPSIELLTGLRLRARHLFRRHQRRSRRSDPRSFHGLHDGGAAHLRAAQERRHLADAAAGRHRRGEPRVRRDRPRHPAQRGARRQAAQARARRDRVQERVLRLRARERRAQGRKPHRSAGAHRGAGRAFRLGQEHDGQPHLALLRSRPGQGPDRRAGHQPGHDRQPARVDRSRDPGPGAVRRHDRRQYRLWLEAGRRGAR